MWLVVLVSRKFQRLREIRPTIYGRWYVFHVFLPSSTQQDSLHPFSRSLNRVPPLVLVLLSLTMPFGVLDGLRQQNRETAKVKKEKAMTKVRKT